MQLLYADLWVFLARLLIATPSPQKPDGSHGSRRTEAPRDAHTVDSTETGSKEGKKILVVREGKETEIARARERKDSLSRPGDARPGTQGRGSVCRGGVLLAASQA